MEDRQVMEVGISLKDIVCQEISHVSFPKVYQLFQFEYIIWRLAYIANVPHLHK